MAIIKYKSGNSWIEIPTIKGSQGDVGNGISSAVLNNDYTLTLTFTNGQIYTTPSLRGQIGPTPVITSSKSGKITTILCDGSPVATITDGEDGHSPIITTSKSGKVTTIYADGASIGTVLDGADAVLPDFLHICTSGEYDSTTRVPTIQNPSANTLYLVPNENAESGDLFSEWVYVDNAWELTGSARIDLSGFAQKVTGATSGNFAGLDANGNLTDSGHKHSDYLTSHQDISGKADKVTSATNGNFASLDSNGNLVDSGHKHSDYLTSHQDISGKANKSTIASDFSPESPYAIGDCVYYNGILYKYTSAHAAGAWDSTQVVEVTVGSELSNLSGDLTELQDDVTSLEDDIDNYRLKRFGVSGIGQSAATLTRIWDSVGLTAQVGTDGNNSSVKNDFDHMPPFNRRKCVGDWSLVNGRAVFTVNAYLGDDDYTEDGTMGDFVAVECPRCYYYLKDGVLGISAHQYPGWRPFDIFCHNHNPNDTIPYYYAPAYALAQKDGKAVSLPGLNNSQGTYATLVNAARTYKNGVLGTHAMIMPAAYNFYEWALFTIEFATQHCQQIMQGCCNLRHNNDDRATLRSDGKWLLGNYQAARVVGEYVTIHGTTDDINSASYQASHKIAEIVRCDADGNADSSGSYQLVTTEDLGSGRTYTTGTAYRFGPRPYATGACNGVSTPSGSPVNNTSGYYPCKYRHHENPFSNQYKTVMDLFNQRVETGDSDYTLDWYFLTDPTAYEPSSTSKPDATELASDKFAKLDITTEHENYVNGYVKSKKYSEIYPDIWVPHETTGASTSTFFADYAFLVNSYVVRSVRFGGYWCYGSTAGFSNAYAHIAPSYAAASYGGDLCIAQ